MLEWIQGYIFGENPPGDTNIGCTSKRNRILLKARGFAAPPSATVRSCFGPNRSPITRFDSFGSATRSRRSAPTPAVLHPPSAPRRRPWPSHCPAPAGVRRPRGSPPPSPPRGGRRRNAPYGFITGAEDQTKTGAIAFQARRRGVSGAAGGPSRHSRP